MIGNTANTLLKNLYANLDLLRCLLTDNALSGPVLSGELGLARVHSCTIANNIIDDGFVMEYFGGSTNLDLALRHHRSAFALYGQLVR